jgi:hypothetical protein
MDPLKCSVETLNDFLRGRWMDRPSRTFSRAGFYLILLFAFFASVSPTIAHVVAVLAFVFWIIEQLIFRNTDWLHEEMFIPIAGFVLFTLLASIVSWINSTDSVMTYSGYLAIFYFVVQRFVSFPEKRKMIIWTFITGVVISSTIDAITRFVGAGLSVSMADTASQEISFFILVVFAVILAFYSEGENLKEKLFFGLIFLPLAAFAVLSLNIYVILISLFLFLMTGIFKDRSALILLGIYAVLLFAGVFKMAPGLSLPEIINTLKATANNLVGNFELMSNISFFGSNTVNAAAIDISLDSFFIKLLAASGPPALLFFSWILVKQLRSDFVKTKKTAYREMRAFHLGILLATVSFILLSLFGSIFQWSSAILVFWMILGMSEI